MLLVVQMFRLAWTPFSLQHARRAGAPQLFSRALTALMLVCAVVFLGVSVLLAVARGGPGDPWLRETRLLARSADRSSDSGRLCLQRDVRSRHGGAVHRARTNVLAWIAGAGAVLNIVICLVAASRWGMVSVAWATPAAYALMSALGAWQSNRVFPVPYEWRRLAQLAAQVTVLFALDRWLQASGLSGSLLAAVLLKCALLLAFPIMLFATGFFRHGEMRALRSMLPRP